MPTERNNASNEFDFMQQEAAGLSEAGQQVNHDDGLEDLPPVESPVQDVDAQNAAQAAAAEAPAKEAAASNSTKSKYVEKPLSEKELEFLKKFPWDTLKEHTGMTYERIMRSYNSESAYKKWTADTVRRFMNGNYVETTVINPLGEVKNAYVSVSIRKNAAGDGYIVRDLHVVDIPVVEPKQDEKGNPVTFVASNGERRFVTVPGSVELKKGALFTLNGESLCQDISDSLRLTGAAGTYYNKKEHFVLNKGKNEDSLWWAPISELEYRKRLNGGAKSIETSESEFPAPADYELGTIRRHVTKYCVGLTPGGQIVRRPVAKVDRYFDMIIAATENKGGPRAYTFVENETGQSYLINKDQTMELARGKVLTLTNKNGYTVSVRYDVLQGKVVPSMTYDYAKRLEQERGLAAGRGQGHAATASQERTPIRQAPKVQR